MCIVCKNLIDEENEYGGECCNFCNETVCEKCYDLEEAVDYYGWICKECK